MLGEFTGRSLHDHQRRPPFRRDPARTPNQVTIANSPKCTTLSNGKPVWMPGALGRTAPRTGRATPARCDADGPESMHLFSVG